MATLFGKAAVKTRVDVPQLVSQDTSALLGRYIEKKKWPEANLIQDALTPKVHAGSSRSDRRLGRKGTNGCARLSARRTGHKEQIARVEVAKVFGAPFAKRDHKVVQKGVEDRASLGVEIFWHRAVRFHPASASG